MVVMPTLPEREKGKDPVVPTVVPGAESSSSERMRQRINGVGGVIESNGRDTESPHKNLQTVCAELWRQGLERRSGSEEQGSKANGRHPVVAVKPSKFGILGEVSHVPGWRLVSLSRHEPEQMAPEKSLLPRRVQIRLLIRVPVVVAVVSRPPERAALRCRSSRASHRELEGPRCLERAV